jgi:outer membrane protein assembly factor BamE
VFTLRKHQRPARNGSSSRWRLAALASAVLLASMASGCGFVGFPGVYRIDVEQGNLVDQEMIEQLKLGMSRRQVRFIMGSPLVEDTFHPDRWDYPYVIRNGTTIIREAQVTIRFEGDRLVSIEGDYLPEWARPPGSDEDENDTGADAGNANGQAAAFLFPLPGRPAA